MRFKDPVPFDFFGDRCRILAEIPGDLLKGKAFVEGFLNIDPVHKRKVFLVSGNKITHKNFLPLLSEGNPTVSYPGEQGQERKVQLAGRAVEIVDNRHSAGITHG